MSRSSVASRWMVDRTLFSVYVRFPMANPPPPYVELHCHSGYSFLDGASHPEELVHQAVELGYPALALTDHDGLYGSMAFAREAVEVGLQPITGVELTVRGCVAPDPNRPLPPATSRPQEPRDHGHVTLLAETPTGYANLCRLVTLAHRESPRGCPSLPLDRLLDPVEGLGQGLILLSGCRRSPLVLALDDSVARAEALARRMARAFGPDRFWVELQENGVRGDRDRNRRLARLADGLGLPVVATGNVHYHHPRRHRLHDVVTAIRHRSTLDGSHHLRRPNACFHLASPGEVAARFASRPDAVTNTLRIAERCAAFDLTRDLGYTFPDFQGSDRGGAVETLTAVTRAALDRRYPDDPAREARRRRAEARRRLDEELRLVERHGLAGFFLVYRDIMELAREVGMRVRGDSPRARAGLPPGRGRGSSVSSIICYLIGLSHVDPVEAGLFLGRFLNDAMGSVPDIDLDFPREIREELILEVYRRYGYDHTGLVATFPTYRLRSAVREVGKVLDLPAGDLEKVTKLAEHRSATGLREDLARIPEFAGKVESRPWRLFLEQVEEIAGLPRHISQHVGGMIISSRPLLELVPLEPAAMEGRVLCQWDKDSCDDAGFIKIDFLALGMLSLVEEAVDLIAERGTAVTPEARRAGIPVVAGAPDLSRIDLNDPAVYGRIQEGDTVGIFQVESRAQIQMLRRTLPTNLAELAVQVAIVRPGPIVGGAVNPYVRRREAQRADPTYVPPFDHPLLEEALGETLGVIIYQDQVLQVCRDLAGFTDGQAESLRRAMSRKRSREAMRTHWEAFREGAARRGVDPETAKTVFRQVVAFSEFGFPKSHSAAFALLAYQSAWLRHHFPTEYYVALFNNQPMGFYSLDALGRDAQRNGIRILPPDVNRSRVRACAEGSDLRVGLGFVRGWGEEMAARVVDERDREGAFRSLGDFLRRTPAALRRPAVENLIWVGGCDGWGLGRRELLWQTGLWLGPDEARTRARGRRDDPQLELGALSAPAAPSAGASRFADLDDGDRLVAEYRMLRFSTRHHPLHLVRSRLPAHVLSSDRIPELENGAVITLAGIVVARQRPQTAKGYVFVLMEDEFGHINVIVKPDVYERCRAAVRMEPFLLVRGRLQKDGATVNLIALEVEALRGAEGRRNQEGAGALPDPMEYWPDPGSSGRREARARELDDLLTPLRSTPPEVKSWG
ncbi:MAG: DNA polymerase III subunit alpha [Gemmatimonadales bacterium]|nr:MAG: DNA polymerase III subunit alpha [Gemmatimonadales bacterium]